MDLEYWQVFQNNQIKHFLCDAGFTLFALILLALSIRYYRGKGKSIFDEWFLQDKKAIARNKISCLAADIIFSFAGIVYTSILLVAVISLQLDIKQNLPEKTASGTVTGNYVIFHGKSHILLDGRMYTYESDLPNAPMKEGHTYSITYLQHSREILQIQEIDD